VHLLVRPKETRGDKHNKETYKKTTLKTKAWTIQAIFVVTPFPNQHSLFSFSDLSENSLPSAMRTRRRMQLHLYIMMASPLSSEGRKSLNVIKGKIGQRRKKRVHGWLETKKWVNEYGFSRFEGWNLNWINNN